MDEDESVVCSSCRLRPSSGMCFASRARSCSAVVRSSRQTNGASRISVVYSSLRPSRLLGRLGLDPLVGLALAGLNSLLTRPSIVGGRLCLTPGQIRHPAGHDQRRDGCQHQHGRQDRSQCRDPGVVACPAQRSAPAASAAVPGSARRRGTAAGRPPAPRPSRSAAPGSRSIALWTIVSRSRGISGFTPVQPRRFVGRHLLDQLVAILLVERRPQGQQLVERQAQRIDVAARVGLALERLRRHVPQRARGCRRCASGCPCAWAADLGQAEVGHPDGAAQCPAAGSTA